MENRSHAFAAGLFVIALALAAALALWWFSQDKDDVDYYLLETRQNVGGLNNQAIVRYRGIRAGRVQDISTDPNDPRVILVLITLDSEFKLTKGTTASLASQGITGLSYVSLEDDGSSPDLLTPKGDQLPRITLRPTLFDNLAARAGAMAEQVLGITTRLNKLLSEQNMQNISRTVDNVAVASDGLRQLPEVMTAIRTAVSPENMKHLNATLAHLEKTAGEAAPLTAEVRELVRSMNQLALRADTLLGSSGGDAANTTLPRANALMQELTQTSRQLSRLLETLDESPQALIFGRTPPRPGPGEPGFGVDKPKE